MFKLREQQKKSRVELRWQLRLLLTVCSRLHHWCSSPCLLSALGTAEPCTHITLQPPVGQCHIIRSAQPPQHDANLKEAGLG